MDKTLNQKIREIQGKVGTIKKDKENPFFNSAYFDINNLLEALTPLFQEQGLTVTQPLNSKADNEGKLQPVIQTIVSDDENSLVYEFPLPKLDDPQKMGSAITYYRRYSLQSLFGLQAEDDDGNKASSGGSKTKQTTEDIQLD